MKGEQLKYFHCDAEKLMDLLLTTRLIKRQNGRVISKLINDLYNGRSIEIAVCATFSIKLVYAAEVILWGKKCGIPKEDWVRVLEKKFDSFD